jgi:hypothetical protein
MSDVKVARLERVDLRQVWRHEAYDFTQWLQDNADILSDATGLSLINVEREKAAGDFSIDLVAEDERGGKVIIENQLGKSDHDHLGKLITYLAAMEAHTAIWIVAHPRPEHVAAVAWMNDSMRSAKIYLLKVEAVRIGESLPAPLLTLILGPSVETESAARAKDEFEERYDARRRWWSALVARPEAKMHAHITPGRYSWIGTSSGIRGLQFIYTVTQNECTAELYIDRGEGAAAENKAIFDQLFAHKAEIDTAFGGPLSWDRLDDKRACRIRVRVPGGYRSPEEEWPSIQVAQVSAMSRLITALKPSLGALKLRPDPVAIQP